METQCNKLNAFSLAELLVVLSILSVLFLIGVRTLRSKSPQVMGANLRKAYANLERVVSYLVNDSGYYSHDDGFADLTVISSEGTSNKFCYWFKNVLNVSEDFGCPQNGDTGTVKIAKSADGAIWYFSPASFVMNSSNYDNKMIVDVNGEKEPNCLSNTLCSTYKPTGYQCECDSPDTFIFGVRYDGKIDVSNDTKAVEFLEDVKKY